MSGYEVRGLKSKENPPTEAGPESGKAGFTS